MITRIRPILPFAWLFSLFLAPAPLLAQWENFQVEHLTIENGLSNNTVYCVYQDRKGFMWFGTENGLNRYDGYTFKKFFHVPGDSTSLSNSYIWSIIEDHTGALWIGTVDGLNKFDRNTETFTHYKHDPADTTSLSNSYVRVVYADHAGTLWVGTTNGVSRFDRATESFRSYNRDESGEDMDETYTLSIYEDHEHTLWVGTGNGLYCFDRQLDELIRDEVWDAFPLPVPLKSVTAIFQDAADTYWFGSFENGVTHRVTKTGNFTRPIFESALPWDKSIRAFCSDQYGNIWGAWLGGLFCFNPRSGVAAHYDYGTGIGYLMDVAIDSSGTIWAGGRGGIYKLYRQSKQFKQYHPVDSNDTTALDRKRITAILMRDSLRVWLGTSDLGVYRFDRKRNKIEHISGTPLSVNSLYADKFGTIWIGGFKAIESYDNIDGNMAETTLKFCVDMNHAKDHRDQPFPSIENVVVVGGSPPLQWPGTWADSDRDKVISLNDSGREGDEMSNDGIWSKDIVFPAFRSLTIQYKFGANMGLRLNNGANDNEAGFGNDHFLQLSPKLKKGIVRNVFGKVGNAVVAEIETNKTQESGAVPTRRDRTLSIYGSPPNTGYVNSFHEDRLGNFWVATDNAGLKKYNRKNEKVIKSYENHPQNPSSLSSNKCKMIFEDSSGDLWIATWAGGLNKYDRSTDSFIHYRHDPNNPNSLSDDHIMVIYEAPPGVLWIGTSSGGINRFDLETKTFIHFTMDDGLPSNNIYAITGDNSGNLWISTDNGLSKMNIERGTFRNYDTKDGLPTTEFNERAWFKSKTGELFFGAQDKLITFFPDSLKDNTYIPPVVLTGFQMFNKTVELDTVISEKKHLVLPYNQNFVAFEFAALNYQTSEKNQYRYKLEGNDESWVDAGTRRLANYTNLTPGDYIFRVIGSNNDGHWNETGASIRLTILPPWWRTNWAYTVYAVLIGLALYGWRHFELNRVRVRNELEMLRKVDEMKSRLFANVSHEFRTPLTLIQGPIEAMQAKSQDAKTREDFGMILQNTKRLLQLINQILDLSKLEAGGLPPIFRRENVTRLLKKFVAAFESMAVHQQIEFTFHAPEQPVYADVDAEQFEKIVFNLLSNAFKFTLAGGEIEVALVTENVPEANSLPAVEYFEISVADSGMGIPADKISRIFERFFQADDSPTRKYEGTGIGLTLAKEFVELHRGEISVTSEVNKGTIFKVRLPMRQGVGSEIMADELADHSEAEVSVSGLAEIAPADKPDLPRPQKAPLVLLVDDNPDMRHYLADCLNREYRIDEASNGEEGLRKATESMPELIVSDVMMPQMDGLEFCRRIKTNEETCHIPVILLTALTSQKSKLEGLETGADDYLVKPFNAFELQARVGNLIEQRRALRNRFVREIGLQPTDIAVTSMDKQLLQRATEIVEEHLADANFGVEMFAEKMLMTRQRLNKKLKALTGRSAGECIRDTRLKRAAQLLEEQSATVTEIAYAVGFTNPAYFAECFRKLFGHNPSEHVRPS